MHPELTPQTLKTILDQVIPHVITAGNYAKDHWESFGTVRYKAIRNPQTDIDVATEAILQPELQKILPEAGFVLEEHESTKKSTLNWAVDPIDGTKFFVTSFPVFFTQVALLQNDEPLLSVIYNPHSKQLFTAIKGAGAFYNGVRKTLAYDGPLSNQIINLEVGAVGNDEKKIEVVTKLMRSVTRLFVISTLMQPYLLTNTVQASVRYYGKEQLYDVAPAQLLITEAGGAYKKHQYGEHDLIIAAHPNTVAEIEEVLGLPRN